jgi:hypothetical protein
VSGAGVGGVVGVDIVILQKMGRARREEWRRGARR